MRSLQAAASPRASRVSVPGSTSHEDGPRPHAANGCCRRDEAVRDGDDLVALANAEARQRQLEGASPGGDPDGARRPAVGGEGLLEGGDLGPERKGSTFEDAVEGLTDLVRGALGAGGAGRGSESRRDSTNLQRAAIYFRSESLRALRASTASTASRERSSRSSPGGSAPRASESFSVARRARTRGQ